MLSSLYFWIATIVCLSYLAGAVAGFYLFRGAKWARGFVGFIAILIVIATTALSVALKSVPILCGVIGVFAIVTVVLLLLSRHDTAA
jgi:hypothetical protein